MKKYLFFLVIFVSNLFLFSQTEVQKENSTKEFINKNEIVFTKNKGQVHDAFYNQREDVLYIMSNRFQQYIVCATGTSHQLRRFHNQQITTSTDNTSEHIKEERNTFSEYYRVDKEWVGGNVITEAESILAVPGYVNYYNLPFAEEGVLNVRQYRMINIKNVYDGIDLRYYSCDGNLRYDFDVAPGIDYKQIKIRISGSESFINEMGELVMPTPLGTITESSPSVFQNGKILNSTWIEIEKNLYGFEIENYDSRYAMIIDPVVLVWGTYYGGYGYDAAYDVAVDNQDNVYLTGYTQAEDNIVTTGAHQQTYGGNYDAFLAKFNSSGVRQWGTYYGGTSDESGLGIAADGSGNVYMTGYSWSVSNIATPDAHQTEKKGARDAFLVKFNSSGVRQWGTYLGGYSADGGEAIAIDSHGNIYISGWTSSANEFSTTGAHQQTYGGSQDAFLAKFLTSGQLVWATYFGGDDIDKSHGVAIDGSGNVIISGITYSSQNIATPGAHQEINMLGWGDAFIAKFNSNGQRLWGTYYGGTGNEYMHRITADNNDNIYVCGRTNSTTNISTPGAYQETLAGGEDIFLAKFNASGQRQWGTYIGGPTGESARACVVDDEGNIYVGGTGTANELTTSGVHQEVQGGAGDAWLGKFNNTGMFKWGTFYGGGGYDDARSLAIDSQKNLYLAGLTKSSGGISTPNAHQTTHGGWMEDSFLGKFRESQAGVENVSKQELVQIFPNPSNDLIFITVPEDFIEKKYSIRDNAGRLIIKKTIEENNFSINIEKFSNGIYWLCFDFIEYSTTFIKY